VAKTLLKNVVTWKGRNDPGDRVIPDHLKLAILSRGRITLPTANVKWQVEIARRLGQTWPDRLRRDLADIFADVRVTVELFQNQRLTMADDTITDVLQNYLALCRLRHMPGCLLVFNWVPHDRRAYLEKNLNLDLSLLFRKPRVRAHRKKPRRYLILVYACFPEKELARYVAPAKIAPPPLPKTPMPPLEAMTSPSTSFRLRDNPGSAGKILGVQVGDEVPVRVLDKQQADGHIWYEIELLQNMRISKQGKPDSMAAGTRCWIVGRRKKDPSLTAKILLNKGPELTGGGLEYIAAPWDFFRFQLKSFERAESALGLNQRITTLRQMSHDKDIPFDRVIGTKPGTLYLDGRKFDPRHWQILMDYQSIRTPDGRVIDLHHLIVGLDVRHRSEKTVSFLNMHVGKNWSASTWAGDLGAGATDMEVKASPEWEARHQKADARRRAEYYFKTRAGPRDLLGDIDIWGIHSLRSNKLKTIDDLLATYYTHTLAESVGTVTSARKDAIERFLGHYGFHYDPAADYLNYPVLVKQRKARDLVRHEIAAFARIWKFRAKPLGGKAVANATNVEFMTLQFLWWLEAQAITNNATVPQ